MAHYTKHTNENNQMADTTENSIDRIRERSQKPQEKSRAYNLFLTLVISTGGAYFGFYISCFNPLGQPILQEIYKIEARERSHIIGNINSLFALGAFVTVLCSGYLCNKIGRMRMLFLAELLSFLTYFMYRVEDLRVLQGVRVLSGIIAAINTAVAQIALKEIMPKRLASMGGMIIYVTCVASVLCVFSLGMLFSYNQLAEFSPYILLIPAPISVFRIVSMLFLRVESPKYYFIFHRKNLDRAYKKSMNVLKKIYEDSYCRGLAEEVKQAVEIEDKKKVTLKSLVSRDYRQQFIAALVVNIGQQVSGINFLILYSTDLFTQISGKTVAHEYTFAMGVIKVLTGFFGTWAINRYGRKPLLLYGVFVQGLGFLMLNILLKMGYKSYILVPITFYLISYALGVGATTLIYTADVLPATGVGVALAVQWIFTGIIGKLVPIVLHR